MPDQTGSVVQRATAADVPAVSRTLAAAFFDDPVFSWIFPDPDRRAASLPGFFSIFAELLVEHEETYLAPGGAAVWVPPGVEPIPEERQDEFRSRLDAVVGDAAVRGRQYNEAASRYHPHAPHFYLQFLGVVPEQQGRGVGGALLRAVLDRCDETRTPAYLEATSSRSRRLYERHGFATVDEVVLPDGPPIWPMLREAVAGAPR